MGGFERYQDVVFGHPDTGKGRKSLWKMIYESHLDLWVDGMAVLQRP